MAPAEPGTNDEWQSGDRRYLSDASMALLKPNRDTGPIAATNSRVGTKAPTSNPTTQGFCRPGTSSVMKGSTDGITVQAG